MVAPLGQVVEIIAPPVWRVPFIFASPHSGRRYPTQFIADAALDLMTLRRSEDAYVDLLVDTVTELGAPLVKALFPRAFVDVNRDEAEIDMALFEGPLEQTKHSRTNRVLAGFGVVPRLAADGLAIYPGKLPSAELDRRLERCYRPYHRALDKLIAQSLEAFGVAILIDCHSMPSHDLQRRPIRSVGGIDFVLGDRYGAACASGLTSLCEALLTERGYRTARNAPYAGGFITAKFGQPHRGVHAVQIEINRALYLDEDKVSRHSGFPALRRSMRGVFSDLVQLDPAALELAQAAE